MGEENEPKGKKKIVKLTNSTEASSINENSVKKSFSGSVNNLVLDEDFSTTDQEEVILALDLGEEPQSSNEQIKLVLPKLKQKSDSKIGGVAVSEASTNLVKEIIHRKSRHTNLTSGRRNAIVFPAVGTTKETESSEESLPPRIPNFYKKNRKSDQSQADVSGNVTE